MSALLLALLVELDAANPETLDALRQRLALRHHEAVAPADYLTDRLLTCSEAAERAHVHAETLRRAIRRGDLLASRAGRSLRIASSDLEEWLGTSHTKQPSAAPARSRSRSLSPAKGPRRPLARALETLDRPASMQLRSISKT
jgi:excisionase family DNA binding protein